MKFRSAALLSCCVLSACATAGGLNTRPENIPTLEQRAAAQPTDYSAATALGVAYYNAKRFDDSRNTLTRVVASDAKSGAAFLYLGLSNEELKDWTAARTAYEKYLDVGAAGKTREQIRARLAYVARQQLAVEAKQVLQNEQQVSAEAPTPRTIAVMPFKLVGTSEDLTPLQTALSDMIITDLSVSPAVTSVERVKVNAMINEMLLAQAGLAEAETGVRVGRLLKAENVVQGVLAQSSEKELRMDATVLNTVRRASAGTFGQQQQIDAIFDLEKAIVFSIFNVVGVTLTAAEREKINENRTGNLLAFLTYGRGLEQLDRGNYTEATTLFRQASQLDPSFQRVQSQQQQANQLQQAAQTSTEQVAAGASGEVTGSAGAGDDGLVTSLTKEVNQSPADNIAQGTTAPTNTQTSATNQAQNQAANPQTSTGNTGGVTQAAKATIILTIKKPGS